MPYFLETISFLSQVLSVILAQRNSLLTYPIGLIGVGIACWIYWFQTTPPLYAEGTLHLYYVLVSLYGWYLWSRKNKRNNNLYPISSLSWMKKVYYLLATILCYLIIWILLHLYTDSNSAQLDAAVSASAAVAMILMAQRKIEHWLMWIASNLIAIFLNYQQGLKIFSFMFFIFLLLAIQGYGKWKKELKITADPLNVSP